MQVGLLERVDAVVCAPDPAADARVSAAPDLAMTMLGMVCPDTWLRWDPTMGPMLPMNPAPASYL